MTPTNPDLRQFILQFFSDEELETLCFDYFREAQQNFSDGMTKNRKVILLIGYCDTRGRMDDLYAALERERPAAWREKFSAPPAQKPRFSEETRFLERDPRQVFISHATADAAFAHRLAGDLRAEGWRVWIAPDSIRPGEKWVEAIERGLETSGVFVVVLTPDAVASRWVNTETDAAVEMQHDGLITFIPLDVVTCHPKRLWQQYQYISFRNTYQIGLEKLLARLKSLTPAFGETEQFKDGSSHHVEKQLRNQIRQLSALNNIVKAVAATLETSQVYATAVAGAGDILGVETSAVYIVEGGRLHCQYARHFRGALPHNIFPAPGKGQGILGRVWSEEEAICINDVPSDSRFEISLDVPTGYNVKSLMATLLTVRGRPIGVLVAFNKLEGPFIESDLDLFSTLASSVSEAIENAWLFQRVRVRHQELIALQAAVSIPSLNRRIHEKTGIELIRIPTGPFLYGEGKEQKAIELPEYWIGRFPVTNAQYKRFLDANPAYSLPFRDADWAKPYNWDKQTRAYPADKADHPVVLVSWNDTKAFCDWAGLRLPMEQEWEKAARGDKDGRIYPWGDDWVDGRCNTSEAGIGGTTRVGQYSPQSDSPYGCADMAGNVWEWTASWYGQKQGGRVLRGGSWDDPQRVARVSIRNYPAPVDAVVNLGFRPVAPVDSGY